MKKMMLLGGWLLLLTGQLLAFSSATINGPIGLIEMPTAFTLEEKQFYIGTSYSRANIWNPAQPLGIEKTEIWQSKCNLSVFRDLELGVIGESGREGVFINFKYYLINPVVSGPLSLALGVENLTSYQRSDIYMVASKLFNQYLAGHFGFKSEFPPGKVLVSAMAGLEIKFSRQFALIADYRGGEDLSRLNVGLKYLFFDVLSFQFSGVDLLNEGRGYSLGVGLINYF